MGSSPSLLFHSMVLRVLLLSIIGLASSAAQPSSESPPNLQGQHFRITVLEERGFLEAKEQIVVLDEEDDFELTESALSSSSSSKPSSSSSTTNGNNNRRRRRTFYHADRRRSVTFSGYLIDMLEAIAIRANFTYDLLPPSGYGSKCNPRLIMMMDDDDDDDSSASSSSSSAYNATFRTQYNCGTSDVNDLPLTNTSTDMYLGLYYITPSRQLQNQFTIPYNPPFSGTLGMFGTATGISSFDALVELQRVGEAPVACAPAGTALLEEVKASYPGIQIKGVYGGEDQVLQYFQDGTCEIYIYDGPLASSFVLRRSQQDECLANGKPIGTIGEPMSFGLSHYAIGIRRDIPVEVTNALSYWMSVLMSCNPLDPDGPCPEGNLASLYKGRGGTGSECGYVLYPDNSSLLTPGAIAGIVLASVVFVVVVLLGWHCYKLRRQARKFSKKAKLVKEQAARERELNEYLAHEVRNPLASAIAASSFVSSKVSDGSVIPLEEHRTSILSDVHVIESSLQFVSELMRNMLDLSRGQQEIKIELAPTDILNDILEPIASILFMRGNTKVAIQVDCPPHLIVQTDRMRLKQIMLNLAGNSTKFVQEGYIRLRAEVKKEPSETTDDNNHHHHNVHLYVEDSGPGIPLDKRDRLFAKFQESLDVLNQGTGIGLCLCSNLSTMLGADLFLDDDFESGVFGYPGTRFTLRLNRAPLAMEDAVSLEEVEGDHPALTAISGGAAAEQVSTTTSSSAASSSSNSNTLLRARGSSGGGGVVLRDLPESLSILFVDDDAVIRKMFLRAVQRVAPNWKVKECSNGETALRLVDNEAFDIIFLDQYMASIEKQLLGTETVRLLRAKGIHCTICGLSANDKEEEFLDAGATGFMLKPFPCRKEELKRELLRLLRIGSASSRIIGMNDSSSSSNNNNNNIIPEQRIPPV